jgi:hypothetical protein
MVVLVDAVEEEDRNALLREVVVIGLEVNRSSGHLSSMAVMLSRVRGVDPRQRLAGRCSRPMATMVSAQFRPIVSIHVGDDARNGTADGRRNIAPTTPSSPLTVMKRIDRRPGARLLNARQPTAATCPRRLVRPLLMLSACPARSHVIHGAE